MKKLTILILLYLILPILSKAQSYDVSINSFGEYNMKGKTFIIVPESNKIHPSDVEFKEYASYIKKVLAIEGARETKIAENADICIFMHYEITDKSYEQNYSVPVIGETKVRSIDANPYSSSLDIKYSQGVTGYRNVQQHVSKYLRVINLSAFENIEEGTMVWKTNIISKGRSNKMREIFPVLAYAAINKIGIDCEETLSINTEGNRTFSDFKTVKIDGKNLYVAPEVYCSLADEGLRIFSIEAKSDETIVTFFKNPEVENVSISPKMFLEFSGNKLYPLNAENIALGRNVKSNKSFFFYIHYPVIFKKVTSINLSEEEDLKIKDISKKKYWKDIQLSK